MDLFKWTVKLTVKIATHFYVEHKTMIVCECVCGWCSIFSRLAITSATLTLEIILNSISNKFKTPTHKMHSRYYMTMTAKIYRVYTVVYTLPFWAGTRISHNVENLCLWLSLTSILNNFQRNGLCIQRLWMFWNCWLQTRDDEKKINHPNKTRDKKTIATADTDEKYGWKKCNAIWNKLSYSARNG